LECFLICQDKKYPRKNRTPLTPHNSPLTPHSSLLTPHSSLLTPFFLAFFLCAFAALREIVQTLSSMPKSCINRVVKRLVPVIQKTAVSNKPGHCRIMITRKIVSLKS
jgi:hypothetical protein